MHGLYVGRDGSGHLFLGFYDGTVPSSYKDLEPRWQDTEASVASTLRFFDPQGQLSGCLRSRGTG